jgi:hypothetical protein
MPSAARHGARALKGGLRLGFDYDLGGPAE